MKHGLKVTGIIFLLLVILGWAGWNFYVSERLAGWVSAQASSALGKPVSIESIHFDPLHLALGKTQISLPQPLSADSITIEGTWKNLQDQGLPREVVISQMQLDTPFPITIEKLALKTSIDDIKNMRMAEVNVEGASITMIQPDVAIEKPTAFVLPLPMTRAQIDALPLRTLTARRVNFSYRQGANHLHTELELHANMQSEKPTLDMVARNLQGMWDNTPFSVPMADVKLVFTQENLWDGTLEIPQLESAKIPVWIGLLAVKSALQITPECALWAPASLKGTGYFANQFKGSYCWAGAKKGLNSTLNGRFQMNPTSELEWNGSIKNDTQLALTLAVKAFPLAQAMDELAQGKLSATGTVSGSFPLAYNLKTKRWSWSKGVLKADAPGLLKLGAGVLPADMGNLSMVSDLLGNLEYQLLELHISADPEHPDKPMVELKVQGNNPLVMDGKPVKLNVRLSGDLLEMLQSSLLPMQNPESMVKSHE